jgi:hypothetical protein
MSNAFKCNTLAPSIAALEKSLSEEYGRRLKAHAKELDRWREDEFAALNSPTQEANFDLDRFLAKYFLDGLPGLPAPHKTKDPLTLEYVSDRSKFNGAVQSIAGLEAHFTSSATIVGWKGHLERAIDAEFAKLDSTAAKLHIPTAEANFDLDRFLAKYFLDGLNGKPAPHKAPDPITLFPFFKHRNRLGAAVVLIPGLYINGANGEHGTVTIIGWDIDEIRSRVRHIEEEVAKKRAKKAAEARAEREREWQQTLQRHHEYVRRHRVPDSPLKLDDVTGSYVVRCDEIAEGYARGQVMTLDIVKPRNSLSTEATFYFGIVEGTMLLAISEDSLEMLRQDVEADSDEDTNQDSDGLRTGIHGNSGSRKRKTKGTCAAPGSIKRRLGATLKANRIYLRWAGRETGEGEIQLDMDNEHTGYLDFDESKLSAKAAFSYPGMFGRDVQFSIFKVADQPLKVPEPWSHFSVKQYNYESTARWGRGFS